MKPLILATLIASLALAACSSSEQHKTQINPEQYKVQDVASLQQRFDLLNQQLSSDYQTFKKNNNIAFSDQSVLDVNQLKTLNLHAVSSTSLKPVKQAYCEMMNEYFAEMYHWGHQNPKLIGQVKLPHAQDEDLSKSFADADQFYDFILNRYTTYRQAQEIMGFGCNLKAALN
jgi:outer membrane murein-binding lipoprotein Lpp